MQALVKHQRLVGFSLAILVLMSLGAPIPRAAGLTLEPPTQDDAGSGRDAPGGYTKDITIQPDIVYKGMSTGPFLDAEDVYHLTGEAGQTFRGWSDGNVGCYYLHDALGNEMGYKCSVGPARNSGPLTVPLSTTGDYYLRVAHLSPATYQFGYSLTRDAPEVRTVMPLLRGSGGGDATASPLPMPEGCNGNFTSVPGTVGQIPRFEDACYHMRSGLNSLDTPHIDVLIVPPASAYAERDLRVMRQAVEMWADGIATLSRQMGLDWLSDGVRFQLFIDHGAPNTDPLWDPEIVVVATNPVGGAGIGIDPLDALFGANGPCHGQPNPLAGFEDWNGLDGFDSHHDGRSGTFTVECEGGGPICYAVNGAIDPAPGVVDFFGLYDLVAHEVGHCLTIGHVGDAMDHKAQTVPYADIMSYTDQPHDKCVSTLDVATFSVTMSRFLLAEPFRANDWQNPTGSFQVQHPADHWYASPTGRAEDCPQPDASIVPGGNPATVPTQNDAGSGQDAPDGISQAITIQPDVLYEGMSPGPIVDTFDVYHLRGRAGDTLKAWSGGNLGCYTLLDAGGNALRNACAYSEAPFNTGPFTLVLPYTGDYYLEIANLAPALYRFGFSLSGEPPMRTSPLR